MPRLRFPRRPRHANRIAVLPAVFTLANAVCGFAAIIYAARIGPGDLYAEGAVYERALRSLSTAGWLIFLGMAFDALDGRIARLSKSTSRFGAELDSLCDAISFGAAPAYLLLKLGPNDSHPILYKVLFVAAIAYVLCTILRLARFNIETTEEESSHRFFRGLPSPAAAGCIASVATMRHDLEIFYRGLIDFHVFDDVIRVVLPFLVIGLALLMVSTIQYPHLVNQMLRGRRAFNHLVQLVVVFILAVTFQELSLALAFWLFAGLGPIRHLLRRDQRTPAATVTAAPSKEAAGQ
jgi:CDP-diacylglycerol--serine O-phosphatidyltransferase